jgi:hypothetical protein
LDKKIINDPPGGKMNFPASVSPMVSSAGALLTKAFTPPTGSPITLLACRSLILVLAGGQRAVLPGVIVVTFVARPEGELLNHIWALIGLGKNIDFL